MFITKVGFVAVVSLTLKISIIYGCALSHQSTYRILSRKLKSCSKTLSTYSPLLELRTCPSFLTIILYGTYPDLISHISILFFLYRSDQRNNPILFNRCSKATRPLSKPSLLNNSNSFGICPDILLERNLDPTLC